MGPARPDAILEVLDEVIIEHDLDGSVRWASPSLRTLLGYDPEAIVGTQFRLPAVAVGGEPAPTEDPGALPDGWRALLQIPRADGSLAWMEVVVRHIQEPHPAAVVVVRDADTAANTGLEWALPGQQADIVQRLDAANRTVWISPSVRWLMGWTQEEILAENRLTRIHPADAPLAAEQLLAVHAGEPEVTVEVRLRQRSGTYLWWQVSARRVHPAAESGEVVLLYRNIDGEVRQRHEAQRQAQLFRSTLDAALEPMVLVRPVWDATGDIVELPIVAANSAAGTLTGPNEAELVGQPLSVLLSAQAEAAVMSACRGVLDDGEVAALHTALADLRLWRADDLLGVTWQGVSTPHAVDLGPGVSYRMNTGGRLEQIDDPVHDLLGFDPQELVGCRLVDLVHPDDAGPLIAAQQAVRQGRVSRLSLRLRTRAGDWRTLTVDLRGTRDASVEVTGVTGSWREPPSPADNSEWRTVLDMSLDPCVVLKPIRDRAGCIVDFAHVDANQQAYDDSGTTREDLLGTTVLGRHGDTGLLRRLIEVAETGEPITVDGAAFPAVSSARFDLQAVPVADNVLVSWRDSTERLLAAERLSESEQRYKLLAENASEVLLQTGKDGRIVWASPSVRTVLGYSPEELTGSRVSDLLEPTEVQRLREEMAANIAAHRPGGERQMRFRTADGSMRWMSALGKALLDERGEVIGGVDALRDIHEQVITRQRLTASESRLQKLLNAMGEGVVVRDANGVIIQCNPAAERILGQPEEQIVGRAGPPDGWQGIHEDGSPFLAEEHPAVVAARTGQSVRGVILGVPLPGDRLTWLLIDAEVLHDDVTGEVEGVITTFIDISERIEAAQQMRKTQARYRLLAENASDFVLMANEFAELVWVSESVEQILGWAPADLLGKTAGLLLHPDDCALVAQWQEATAQGLARTDRLRVRHADGTYRWFVRSAHPVRDDPDTPNGSVAGYRDIQAEVEAEELLAASERRYRLLAETMTDLVEEYDTEWNLVWASPSSQALLGFSPDELVGSFAPNLIHPDEDTAADRTAVDQGLNEGITQYRRRVRRLRADGSHIWVDSLLSFRYDQQGRHVATYITSRDIDAQVRAEEDLARSQQRFLRMFTEHDAIMLLLDPANGAIIDANRAASRFYGYPREALAAMRITDINMAPPAEVERQIQAAVQQRRNSFTFPHRLADGSIRTVEIHSSTIEDGDRTLLFSIIRDITDDLAAREQLAASEQRYRLLAENASDFVVFAGVDGAIKWISPSAQRLLGWHVEDVVGRSLEDFVHPGDRAELPAHESHASGTVVGRIRMQTADGHWRWFLASSKPARDDVGTLTGRVTGFQDVQAETEAREALGQAHERLELVLGSSGLGLWDWDMRTDETVFNQRWAQILGYELYELQPTTADTWFRLMHPDDLPLTQRAVAAHRAGKTDAFDVDVRMLHKDGHWVWVRDRGRIVERDEEGTPVRMTGTHEDITALKHAAEALAASEHRFRVAMASAPVGMAVLDLDRRITQVNPALCALLSHGEQWLVGRNIADIIDPDDDVVDRSARSRLRRNPDQAVTVEHRLIRSDGARVWVQQSLNLVNGPGGRPSGYVSQFADVTEAREARHRLRDLAGRDPLTDLLNRRELTTRLRLVMDDQRGLLALLFIDLDGLKQVNDTHGHVVGDQVIRVQARRLRDAVGEENLVARYGGDEFVVVLLNPAELSAAEALAERIHGATRTPIRVGDLSISLTCSIGIATSAARDFDAALEGADAAAYRAKRAGRNCTRVYDPQLDGGVS